MHINLWLLTPTALVQEPKEYKLHLLTALEPKLQAKKGLLALQLAGRTACHLQQLLYLVQARSALFTSCPQSSEAAAKLNTDNHVEADGVLVAQACITSLQMQRCGTDQL